MDGIRFNATNIQGTDAFENVRNTSISKPAQQEPGADFSKTLKDAIQSVDQLQKDADVKMQELVTGKSQNIHETMIAAEKADVALRLMIQVRNKIMDAYQEIMRMQV